MTPEEIGEVLGKAAATDRRKVGTSEVLAWYETIGDLPFDDAMVAVTRHYRDTDDWMMPVHIRRYVEEIQRERRRAQRERLEQAAIEAEAADPTRRDRSPQVQALLDHVLGRIGAGRPDALRRPEWLENDRRREREARAEPNPDFTGPPPADGWPLPIYVSDAIPPDTILLVPQQEHDESAEEHARRCVQIAAAVPPEGGWPQPEDRP